MAVVHPYHVKCLSPFQGFVEPVLILLSWFFCEWIVTNLFNGSEQMFQDEEKACIWFIVFSLPMLNRIQRYFAKLALPPRELYYRSEWRTQEVLTEFTLCNFSPLSSAWVEGKRLWKSCPVVIERLYLRAHSSFLVPFFGL